MDYEGYRRDSQQLLLGNIPTLQMRSGDFGETAAIYDPTTTRAGGSGFVRTRFANNQIPANRWDPIAAKMINAYPPPTGTAASIITSRTPCRIRTGTRVTCAWTIRSRPKIISSPDSPFRTPRPSCPALIRRPRIPGNLRTGEFIR